jgi:hypothetical protein
MSEYVSQEESDQWLCAQCGLPLEMKAAQIAYMESVFPVDLPTCPKCGMIYLPESLALGKMVEVEKSLEDK